MTEYAETLHAWLAQIAAADPARRRFGARHHDYRLAPPVSAARLAAIEDELGLRLPDAHRELVTTVGDGGAGPFHGLMPLDHPVQLAAARGTFALTTGVPGPGPAELAGCALYQGVVGLGHVGCGYLTFLVVRGPAAGQVWLDLRSADQGVLPIEPDVASYHRDWIARASRNQLPEPHVNPGRCALPVALSSYLATCERERGLAPGGLAGEPLRGVLAAIGPGAIRCTTSGDDPFFASGDLLDLCPRCEQMVENLLPRGLRRDQLALGLPPLPSRPGAPLRE